MTISHNEYWEEVRDIAQTMAVEAMADNENDRDSAEEDIFDSRLHETIDGHQWIIYNAYNLSVIEHSENEAYYEDNFGGEALAASLKEGGLSTLHCHMAFWCLYADVMDKISDALDEVEERAEENN